MFVENKEKKVIVFVKINKIKLWLIYNKNCD